MMVPFARFWPRGNCAATALGPGDRPARLRDGFNQSIILIDFREDAGRQI
jgi:hypothetical protein